MNLLDILISKKLGLFGSGGGVTSYNDLKDRPFYEETEVVNEPLNITWDGNTEGRVVIDEEGNGEVLSCKVSDLILTDEQIKKCWVTILGGSGTNTLPVEGDVWENAVAGGWVTEHITAVQTVLVVRKAGAELFGVTYPEAGIYFTSFPNDKEYTHELYSEEPIEQTKTVVHKLDKKYLPDDVGGGMFVVEVDWDADKVITPLNEIRDAWLAHKMVVLFGRLSAGTRMYTFAKGSVHGETGDLFSAVFANISVGHVYFYYINSDGTIEFESYDVEMTLGK